MAKLTNSPLKGHPYLRLRRQGIGSELPPMQRIDEKESDWKATLCWRRIHEFTDSLSPVPVIGLKHCLCIIGNGRRRGAIRTFGGSILGSGTIGRFLGIIEVEVFLYYCGDFLEKERHLVINAILE
ncbi:hypothetical protein NPIL_22311 [Nephila pilipes]|uniref:Uncharacterized protein n=1 Tax=Nephila pilipes TaxID=299642 RepID=A0A8X6PJR1_NEPPI|nr:hypothetical protein NPIL_22311 [Nephila pilipes]